MKIKNAQLKLSGMGFTAFMADIDAKVLEFEFIDSSSF